MKPFGHPPTVKMSCAPAPYLMRCNCELIHGRMIYREQCQVHGPSQPVVYIARSIRDN